MEINLGIECVGFNDVDQIRWIVGIGGNVDTNQFVIRRLDLFVARLSFDHLLYITILI